MSSPISGVEYLLGFDARRSLPLPDAGWSAERREQFLLRPDVPRVCSADRLVWPSAFAKGFPLPGWSASLGLWDNLTALRARLRQGLAPGYSLIAVTAFVPPAHEPLWLEKLPQLHRDAVDDAWERLGYDVVDQWLLSGLSNSGLELRERADARHQYLPQINDEGLFAEPAFADLYRRDSDVRLRAHAPFFVAALYEVDPA